MGFVSIEFLHNFKGCALRGLCAVKCGSVGDVPDEVVNIRDKYGVSDGDCGRSCAVFFRGGEHAIYKLCSYVRAGGVVREDDVCVAWRQFFFDVVERIFYCAVAVTARYRGVHGGGESLYSVEVFGVCADDYFAELSKRPNAMEQHWGVPDIYELLWGFAAKAGAGSSGADYGDYHNKLGVAIRFFDSILFF